MIESLMYFGMGFCLASLGVLVTAPLVHGRAVRLTMRQLEGAIPTSRADILADKDLLRAEFAMSTRRLETTIEQLRTKSASQFAELGRKDNAINRLKIELGALRDQVGATKKEFAVKAASAQEAGCALSDKQAQLAQRIDELKERPALTDAQEMTALQTPIEALQAQLDGAVNQLKAAARRPDLNRALSDKQSELAQLTDQLKERSTLADAQHTEIIALKAEIEILKEQFDKASNELKAVEERRNSEHLELARMSEKLLEERGKFENFHRQVGELVKDVMTQSTQDKIIRRRGAELEKRLLEQSQLLNERELALTHLRREFEIARKAEADLRVALIEIDGREHVSTQNLKAENAKLQSALERSNGERMRLAYELANKSRRTEAPWAAAHDVDANEIRRLAC
jgi:chromosome segregation ATPase